MHILHFQQAKAKSVGADVLWKKAAELIESIETALEGDSGDAEADLLSRIGGMLKSGELIFANKQV